MAEQLAENYHNTWGRKKKLELQAKGGNAHLWPTAGLFFWFVFIAVSVSSGGLPVFVQEVGHTLCWCPTTHSRQKKRPEIERRRTSCSSSCSWMDTLWHGTDGTPDVEPSFLKLEGWWFPGVRLVIWREITFLQQIESEIIQLLKVKKPQWSYERVTSFSGA